MQEHLRGEVYLAFVVEGSAEKFVIETLIKSKKIIEKFRPKNEYMCEITNVCGVDKLTYSFWENETNFNPSEKRKTHFIVVGDNLKNGINNFVRGLPSKKNLKMLIGEKYIERINYVSSIPEIEILLIHHFDLEKKWRKSKENIVIFLIKELKIDKKSLKSYKFWNHTFKKQSDLLKAIKKVKKIEDPEGKIMSLSEIIIF